MATTTSSTPLLTPTKHASISAWAKAIPSLRLHHINPADHCESLEPYSILMEGLYDDEDEVDDAVVQKKVMPDGLQGSDEVGDRLGEGNVIDWTHFHRGRTVAWAPWEFPEEREEGFFTDMSGFTNVSVTTTRSMLREMGYWLSDDEDEIDDEHDGEEDEDEKTDGEDEDASTSSSSTGTSRDKWEVEEKDSDDTGYQANVSSSSPSPSAESSDRDARNTPSSSMPISSGHDTSWDLLYPITMYYDEEWEVTDHEAVLNLLNARDEWVVKMRVLEEAQSREAAKVM